LKSLGEGGMAVIYRAYDTTLDCDVAIKFVRMERLSAESIEKTIKRFKIEAQKTAKLSHPIYVPVTDYGEFEGFPICNEADSGREKRLNQCWAFPIPYEKLLSPCSNCICFEICFTRIT